MTREAEVRRRSNALYWARTAEQQRPSKRAWWDAEPNRYRDLKRAWRAANPERVRAYGRTQENRRRALELRAGGSHTLEEWVDKCALLGNVCIYCGEAKPLTIDHKVPLSRGGTDDISNIVPACRSCNSRKRVSTATEYIAILAPTGQGEPNEESNGH